MRHESRRDGDPRGAGDSTLGETTRVTSRDGETRGWKARTGASKWRRGVQRHRVCILEYWPAGRDRLPLTGSAGSAVALRPQDGGSL